MKKALLIIDMQNELIWNKPFAAKEVVENIKKLISKCREKEIEIIYIQHEEEVGSPYERGTDTWKIYNEIEPNTLDKIISKNYNSAFKETELKEYLDKKGMKELIITGMQTEYCFDTTIKVAFEFGYKIVIPEMTNTTFDNSILTGEELYTHYNFNIFKNRFAQVIDLDTVINNL